MLNLKKSRPSAPKPAISAPASSVDFDALGKALKAAGVLAEKDGKLALRPAAEMRAEIGGMDGVGLMNRLGLLNDLCTANLPETIHREIAHQRLAVFDRRAMAKMNEDGAGHSYIRYLGNNYAEYHPGSFLGVDNPDMVARSTILAGQAARNLYPQELKIIKQAISEFYGSAENQTQINERIARAGMDPEAMRHAITNRRAALAGAAEIDAYLEHRKGVALSLKQARPEDRWAVLAAAPLMASLDPYLEGREDQIRSAMNAMLKPQTGDGPAWLLSAERADQVATFTRAAYSYMQRSVWSGYHAEAGCDPHDMPDAFRAKLDWIGGHVASGAIMWSELEAVGRDLAAFDKAAPLLSQVPKDIYDHTPESIRETASNFTKLTKGLNVLRSILSRPPAANLLIDDGDTLAVVPMTPESANYWRDEIGGGWNNDFLIFGGSTSIADGKFLFVRHEGQAYSMDLDGGFCRDSAAEMMSQERRKPLVEALLSKSHQPEVITAAVRFSPDSLLALDTYADGELPRFAGSLGKTFIDSVVLPGREPTWADIAIGEGELKRDALTPAGQALFDKVGSAEVNRAYIHASAVTDPWAVMARLDTTFPEEVYLTALDAWLKTGRHRSEKFSIAAEVALPKLSGENLAKARMLCIECNPDAAIEAFASGGMSVDEKVAALNISNAGKQRAHELEVAFNKIYNPDTWQRNYRENRYSKPITVEPEVLARLGEDIRRNVILANRHYGDARFSAETTRSLPIADRLSYALRGGGYIIHDVCSVQHEDRDAPPRDRRLREDPHRIRLHSRRRDADRSPVHRRARACRGRQRRRPVRPARGRAGPSQQGQLRAGDRIRQGEAGQGCHGGRAERQHSPAPRGPARGLPRSHQEPHGGPARLRPDVALPRPSPRCLRGSTRKQLCCRPDCDGDGRHASRPGGIRRPGPEKGAYARWLQRDFWR